MIGRGPLQPRSQFLRCGVPTESSTPGLGLGCSYRVPPPPRVGLPCGQVYAVQSLATGTPYALKMIAKHGAGAYAGYETQGGPGLTRAHPGSPWPMHRSSTVHVLHVRQSPLCGMVRPQA